MDRCIKQPPEGGNQGSLNLREVGDAGLVLLEDEYADDVGEQGQHG